MVELLVGLTEFRWAVPLVESLAVSWADQRDYSTVAWKVDLSDKQMVDSSVTNLVDLSVDRWAR